MLETSTGQYLALGELQTSNTAIYDLFAIKFDSDGTILWFKSYGVGSNLSSQSMKILEMPNGKYLCGSTSEDRRICSLYWLNREHQLTVHH